MMKMVSKWGRSYILSQMSVRLNHCQTFSIICPHAKTEHRCTKQSGVFPKLSFSVSALAAWYAFQSYLSKQYKNIIMQPSVPRESLDVAHLHWNKIHCDIDIFSVQNPRFSWEQTFICRFAWHTALIVRLRKLPQGILFWTPRMKDLKRGQVLGCTALIEEFVPLKSLEFVQNIGSWLAPSVWAFDVSRKEARTFFSLCSFAFFLICGWLCSLCFIWSKTNSEAE